MLITDQAPNRFNALEEEKKVCYEKKNIDDLDLEVCVVFHGPNSGEKR